MRVGSTVTPFHLASYGGVLVLQKPLLLLPGEKKGTMRRLIIERTLELSAAQASPLNGF